MGLFKYYKSKAVNGDISVEYNSEDDRISVEIMHRINKGDVIGTERLYLYPSFVEPLINLLREVAPPKQDKE